MLGIIAIILVLGGLIFFHELGHFMAARLLGIGVETFSIAFGKSIWSRQGKKTRYKLGILPLGGYVSLAGERDAKEISEPFTKAESFALRPPLHRLLLVIAGPLFNILLAWLIYWGLFAGGQVFIMPEVGKVLQDSPADEAGLVPGDIVVSVSGHKITGWEDMLFQVRRSNGVPMLFEVERGGRLHEFEITAVQHQFTDAGGKSFFRWLVGIEASKRMMEKGLFEAAVSGLRETWNTIVLIGVVLGDLFTGEEAIKDSVGGPVMIGQTIHSQATHGGLQAVLKLSAMLSINLGLLNLLPIPALDGGHVFFNLIETIFRRPVPVKIQSTLTYAGFSFLIVLMMLATVFDLFRLSGIQD